MLHWLNRRAWDLRLRVTVEGNNRQLDSTSGKSEVLSFLNEYSYLRLVLNVSVVWMALTTITLTLFLSMIAIIFTILVGHYAGRSPNTGTIQALVVSGIAIPIGIVIVSIPLYNIALHDWSGGAYFLPPQFAIWAAAFFGGLIGLKSGEIWNQGEPSCIKCLLSLVTAVTLLSLVIVLIP